MPLIQPRRGLIRRPRGPFAFPGTNPGFDPAHMASFGLWASAIAQGANFFNPATGAVSTLTGSPTAKVLMVGPALSMSGTQRGAFIVPSGAPSAVTIAAMFFWNGTNAASQDISGNNSLPTGGSGTDIALTSAGIPQIRFNGGTSVSTIPALTANSPYFFAASGNQVSFNITVCRLDTGQMFSQSLATGAYASGNGTFCVGNIGDGTRPVNGALAAAMMSTALLSQQKLAQWAADPWGFWYPR
jgi:hypothetical protein